MQTLTLVYRCDLAIIHGGSHTLPCWFSRSAINQPFSTLGTLASWCWHVSPSDVGTFFMSGNDFGLSDEGPAGRRYIRKHFFFLKRNCMYIYSIKKSVHMEKIESLLFFVLFY